MRLVWNNFSYYRKIKIFFSLQINVIQWLFLAFCLSSHLFNRDAKLRGLCQVLFSCSLLTSVLWLKWSSASGNWNWYDKKALISFLHVKYLTPLWLSGVTCSLSIRAWYKWRLVSGINSTRILSFIQPTSHKRSLLVHSIRLDGKIYSWFVTKGAPWYFSEDVDKECHLAMITGETAHTHMDTHHIQRKHWNNVHISQPWQAWQVIFGEQRKGHSICLCRESLCV